MTLSVTLFLILIAAFIGFVTRNNGRLPILVLTSTLAVYALQPALPIRNLDFWLPTITLGLTILGWIVTTPSQLRSWRENWLSILIVTTVILLLGLTRYLGFSLPFTASRPPPEMQIIIALGITAFVGFLLSILSKAGRVFVTAGLVIILLFFIFLKFPPLTIWLSKLLRGWNGQATDSASALDIRWLGFSYIAFRILHTLRDRQSGRLPAVNLSEYIIYIIFFPALAAGPIDRIERFIGDLRRPLSLTVSEVMEAGKRLVLGLFKKFAVADTLALFSLNATNAAQIHVPGWSWVLLYAFTFQILFDFSGYTDIAIGLGMLVGIKLPENFKSPYLKPNLTQFWNNWHITLTQWFRTYFFNPVTRALRSSRKRLSIPLIIFITQVSTMILIGLWHGATLNFILWGLWHGLGLFVHNRWSEWTKSRFAVLPLQWQKIFNLVGTFLTFNFVAIGWIFFTLPTPSASGVFFQKLIGLW